MHTIINGCVLFLWLQTLTFVKSQDCTLEQFLNSRLYDSNFDTTGLQASYPGGKQLRVGCNVGYSGFFKLICVEGKWQSRGNKCQPKSCGHPGDAEFAEFHLDKGDDFVFGSQVVYTCHQGYQMVSRTNVRRCMAEGWDGKIPVCEAQLCPVIHVNDNVQVFGDTEEATYGKVVRFSCKSSTEILDGPTEIFCNENSEWNEEPPVCKEITCDKPTIENGIVLGGIEVYREHEVLNYKCNPKYKRAEERSSKCTKVVSRAEWSPTPLCESARCELNLPPFEGTRYEPPFRSAFSPGDRVRVICGENYWILNEQTTSTEILCQDDGSWNHRPVCREIICSNAKDPLLHYWGVSSWGQKKVGSTAVYSCISGYKSTNGGDRATCTRDGWTPKPLCQEITCPRKDYQNAVIAGNIQSVYKYDDRVRYNCKYNQYYYTLTCTEHGWRGSVQCPDKGCQRRDIENAVIIHNDRSDGYRHGDHVEYRCSHGAEETFIVTCQQGEWTGIKSCSACEKPVVEHGFVVHPNYTVPTAYYSCNEGYKPSTKGWWAETKCNEGVWSDLTCIEQSQCGKGPVIPNGKATQRETRQGPVQTLQITCDPGYSASITQLNCHDGQWNIDGLSLKTICTSDADLCGPPPKVENAVVTTSYQKEYLSDSEVTYQCRDKYKIMDEDTIRCERGKWEEKNIECVPFCGKLKDEKKTMSFRADKKMYMTGEFIEYQCVVPEPIPEGIATCEGGTWIKTVECKVKPCPRPSDTPHGQHTIIKGEGYVFGTVVKYSCNERYRMVSQDSTQICTLRGWNGSVPMCERVTCQIGAIDPGLIAPSGNEIVRAGEKLQFRCRNDYDLEGDSELQCLGTGEWSGPFPTCSQKCQVPSVPSNVIFTPQLQRLSKGETLTFSCKQRGHRIQGSRTVECLETGLWSGQVPTCGDPSYCGRPPTLEDGDTMGTAREQYNRNDRVEYSCQNYYTMEGGPYKTCINGQWTGDIRCLKPCTVDKEAMTQRNIRFRYTDQYKLYSAHNDMIEFVCTKGRPVGLVEMRQRCLHGVIELPTCE